MNGQGMAPAFDADVLIIGAGPVGLVAALDLDRKGVSTIVVEQRAFLQSPEVKSNHVAARTMERFRRLGIADRIRDAGMPHDHPHDVAFRTSVAGIELSRVLIPSPDGRRSRHPVGADADWPAAEAAHRINQTFLEPILAQQAVSSPRIELRHETRFVHCEQDAEGVTAFLSDLGGGDERIVRARYLIGADGGRSTVRKQIGAALQGDPVLQQVQSTCVRAPGLYELMRGERAWCYYVYGPHRNGHVFTIDGEGAFLIHNYLSSAEFETGSVDRDAAIRDILGIDEGFEYEIRSTEDWTARRLVADRLRDGRVFIAGDAAHLWVPYAGFGMNAGIADALNLTWLLAAVLTGWAGPAMLEAYEAERLPITEQVSRFAMDHQRKLSHEEIPPEIDDATPAGAIARDRIGRYAVELNAQQFAAAGLNFGYHYDASPIIHYDGGAAPDYTMGSFTPSTAPGCRVPHFWLPDGSSVYDRFGDGYTLLCFADPAAALPIIEASEAAGLPLEVVDVRWIPARDHDHDYLIAREDQHIAWRGNAMPTDPAALIAELRGLGYRSEVMAAECGSTSGNP